MAMTDRCSRRKIVASAIATWLLKTAASSSSSRSRIARTAVSILVGAAAWFAPTRAANRWSNGHREWWGLLKKRFGFRVSGLVFNKELGTRKSKLETGVNHALDAPGGSRRDGLYLERLFTHRARSTLERGASKCREG